MKKTLNLGMAARMVPDKHHELLIDVIIENKKSFMKYNVKTLFAGEGFLKDNLIRKVENNRINDLIIFSGSLKERELINWFKKLDIYIHLSKDETTSTSILQAMSMSLPIIASKIGGNINLLKKVKDERNMFLVNNNQDDVFIKIKNLIKNKSKRLKMSKFARLTAERYFSCERMFKNYQKLF
jgi:colanic acid/amylovoran biosynthesis glycosyltransferase